MSRWIDADVLNIYDISPADGFAVMGVTEEDIDLAPSIDICFCRECKYYNGKYCFNSDESLPVAPKPDDFCSYGCRKE